MMVVPKFEFCKGMYGMKPGVNLFHIDVEKAKNMNGVYTIEEGEVMKKFGVIAGNPPYQADQQCAEKRGGGTTLWDKFVDKSIDLTKDNGFVCLVHPCGWRNGMGEYKKLGERMKGLQLRYLEIHDSSDGLKTFGAGTSYDWYVLHNCPNSKPTTIKCQDGKTVVVSVKDMPFIPSGMFAEIQSLLAKDGETRVEIVYSRSAYGSDYTRVEILQSQSAYESRKPYIQKEKDDTHPYPVIHNVRTTGELVLIHSSRNDRGHFGVPKVIFGRRQCGTFVDKEGLFGMSQDCRGMLGHPKELDKINQAMNNPRFIEICKYLSLNSTAKDKYDYRVLSLFRKDFWKEFL